MNISTLQAHIKGLNEKLEEAATEAAENGGFGDRVAEVKGLAAELAAARETDGVQEHCGLYQGN